MATSLKLLQYNCFLRPPPVNMFGGEFKEKRLNHFCEEFLDNRYDVVCLQECFETLNWRRAKLVKASKTKGFPHHSSSKRGSIIKCNGTIKLIDGGLVVLSKFPIVVEKFHAFSAAVDVDKLARKGVLYTRLDLGREDKRNVHLFTTHTQASYNFAASKGSLDAKTQQIKELGKFIKVMTENTPKDWPIVVTGDFNMDALQDFCPEYELTHNVFEECRRHDHSDTAYVDALKEHNDGKFLPTTAAFEWRKRDGMSVRSSLLTKDSLDHKAAHELHKTNSNGSDNISSSSSSSSEDKSQPKAPTNAPDYFATDDTFWASQCLDFVFFERSPHVHLKMAEVEPFVCDASELPYSQISDHHGVIVELEFK